MDKTTTIALKPVAPLDPPYEVTITTQEILIDGTRKTVQSRKILGSTLFEWQDRSELAHNLSDLFDLDEAPDEVYAIVRKALNLDDLGRPKN